MTAPVISVVVPTFNRAALLDKHLASLCAQRLSPDLFEVIVVDNLSQDHTREVVAAYEGRQPQVRYVLEFVRNTSIARNTGYRLAVGGYLAYFDDDTIVPPEHLANALAVIRQHEPDMLGGPVYPYFDTPKPWWFKDKYETKRFTEESGFSQTCRLTGANFKIKREVLRQLGLFDPAYGPQGYNHLIGDERKLLEAYRLTTPVQRQKIYYALECSVQHYILPHKMVLRNIVVSRFRAGLSMGRIYQEVHGFNPGGRQVAAQALRWPVKVARAFVRQARLPKGQGADYFGTFINSFIEAGMIVERFRQVVWRRFSPPGRAGSANATERAD